MKNLIISLIAMSFLIACGGESGGGSNDNNNDGDNSNNSPRNGETARTPLNFNAIDSKYNPHVHEETFSTSNLSKIDLNVLGIKNEVLIERDDSLSGQGRLLLYRVWFKTSNYGYLDLKQNFETLRVRNYTGSNPYSCSKRITNGKIKSLNGGCNLFAKLILPKGEKIEVYSNSNLVSNRYFAMTNNDLRSSVEDARTNEDKIDVIEAYLKSHRAVGSTPSLECDDLEQVLSDFRSFDDAKFSALKMLHRYVQDRENLEEHVINEVFSFRDDRERALRIIGLR